MTPIPASVFILTFNSAATLGRALASVARFDDVFICDGGSIDATLDIARAHGARIVPQDPACLERGKLKDFACARNGVLAHAKHPWILFIDSDESASTGLVEEIEGVIAKKPRRGAYRIPAGIVLDGRNIRYSSNYPGYQLRFFHREAGMFKKPIHERFIVNEGCEVGTLKNPWHYYVSSAEIREEFQKDVVRDMPLYTERYKGASFFRRIRGSLLALKSVMGIGARAVYNALIHRGPSTYPLRLEWLRILYQWEIIKTLLLP